MSESKLKDLWQKETVCLFVFLPYFHGCGNTGSHINGRAIATKSMQAQNIEGGESSLERGSKSYNVPAGSSVSFTIEPKNEVELEIARSAVTWIASQRPNFDVDISIRKSEQYYFANIYYIAGRTVDGAAMYSPGGHTLLKYTSEAELVEVVKGV